MSFWTERYAILPNAQRNEFLNGHLGTPYSVVGTTLAANLVWEYHVRCEAFDRSVCTELRGEMAWPRTMEERVRVNQNSYAVRMMIERRAAMLRVSHDDLAAAFMSWRVIMDSMEPEVYP